MSKRTHLVVASVFFSFSVSFAFGGFPLSALAQACNQKCEAGYVCAIDQKTKGTFCNRLCSNGKGANADNYCPEDDITVSGTKAAAPTSQGPTFANLVDKTIVPFVDTYVISLLYAILFLLFMFGVFRYFFTGGDENRQKARPFIVWSLIGIVAVFSVWGVIQLLLSLLTV